MPKTKYIYFVFGCVCVCDWRLRTEIDMASVLVFFGVFIGVYTLCLLQHPDCVRVGVFLPHVVLLVAYVVVSDFNDDIRIENDRRMGVIIGMYRRNRRIREAIRIE